MKKRNKPNFTVRQKYQVLYQTGCKCSYCDTELTLETMIMEHFKPYCLTRSNSINELTPSCWDCNSIKSNKTFTSFDAARQYINNERKNRNLPYLQSAVQPQPDLAEILLSEMSDNQLLEEQRTEANLINPSRVAEAYLAKRYGKRQD